MTLCHFKTVKPSPQKPTMQATSPKKPLIKEGEFFFLEQGNTFLKVVTTQAQTSARSKKIWVNTGRDKVWAFIDQLITPENYQQLIDGRAQLAAEEAEAVKAEKVAKEASDAREVLDKLAKIEALDVENIRAGDWFKLEGDYSEARIVEASRDLNGNMLWVKHWEGDRTEKEFLAKLEHLTRITAPEVIAEAVANKAKIQANLAEYLAAIAAEDKAREEAQAQAIQDQIAADEPIREAHAAMLQAKEAEALRAKTEAKGTTATAARINAEHDAAVAAMYRAGQGIFWKSPAGDYRRAQVYRDQSSVTSKTIRIIHWNPKQNNASDPHKVDINDVLRVPEYEALKAKNAAEDALKASTEATPAAEVKAVFNSPESYAELMKQANTPDDIKALCDRLLALPMFDTSRISEKTKMQRLSKYNVAINKASIELAEGINAVMWKKPDGSQELRHLHFKLVGVLDYDWGKDNKKADAKLLDKLDNQVIELDGDQYIETIKFCLVDDNPFVNIAGLIADSGRRIIEILHTGKFAAIAGEPQMISFTGQAKLRGAEEITPRVIMLLTCTATQFINKLEKVRSHDLITAAYDGLALSDPDFLKTLSDRVRVNVNRLGVIKKFCWLPKRAGESNPSTKTLRAMTAAIIADRHCPATTNKLLYTSRLLGHFKEGDGDLASLQITLGYSDIVVKSSVTNSGTSPADVPDLEDDQDPLDVEVVTADEVISDLIEDLIADELDQFAEAMQAADAPEEATAEAIAEAPEEVPEETTQETPAEVIAEALAVAGSPYVLAYVDAVEASAGERHPHDFYETPDWLPLAILDHANIEGTIGEPCAGYNAIADVFKMAGFNVWTNDLDTQKPADYHGNAADPEYMATLPDADWLITNPPYKDLSAPIVANAFSKAKKGIVMVLKMNWWEVCKDRVQFLKDHPPTCIINVPRYCYRKGTATGKWATDEAPTIAYIWDKSITHGLTKLICLTVEDLALFHRNPDGKPSRDAVQQEVDRIMAKKQTEATAKKSIKKPPAVVVSTSDLVDEKTAIDQGEFVGIEHIDAPKNLKKVTHKMIPFLLYNKQLELADRWYVSQTIIKNIAGCNNTTANLWINHYRDYLTWHNEGLKGSRQNQHRTLDKSVIPGLV